MKHALALELWVSKNNAEKSEYDPGRTNFHVHGFCHFTCIIERHLLPSRIIFENMFLTVDGSGDRETIEIRG